MNFIIMIGMNWACDPLLTVELLPQPTRGGVVMTFHTDTTLDLKKSKVSCIVDIY